MKTSQKWNYRRPLHGARQWSDHPGCRGVAGCRMRSSAVGGFALLISRPWPNLASADKPSFTRGLRTALRTRSTQWRNCQFALPVLGEVDEFRRGRHDTRPFASLPPAAQFLVELFRSRLVLEAGA